MTIAKSGRGKGQRLRTKIEEGRLVISIGVDTLAFAAQQHYDEDAFNRSEGEEEHADFRIVDKAAFAKSVVKALDDEQEDGTTPVHLMLDAAFDWLVDHSFPEGTVEVTELTERKP